MRVLVGSGNYPKLSESYIEAEIQYLLRCGHDVRVYSPVVGSPGAPELVRVYRDLNAAIKEFRPQVFHVHYLTFEARALDLAHRSGVPITVRGHSFDFGVDRAARAAAHPGIRRIWLFPHFADLVPHPKVAPLPVAYDSTLYRPSQKNRKLVYRTGAGKPGKGLEQFFEIARMCPEFRFCLTANVVLGAERYMDTLAALAAGSNVEYHRDIGREEAVRRMSEAGIYLDTSDPGAHPFGMPISIAEAMATGCHVVARDGSAARAYVGPAGDFYGTPAQAAGLIRATLSWGDDLWSRRQAEAADRAAARHADHAVLPAELLFWETLV